MSEKMSRRAVLHGGGVLALSAFTTSVLASCSAPNTGTSGAGPSKDFSFYSWDTTSDTPLAKVANSWAKSKNVNLHLTTIPYNNYDAKMLTVFSSGNEPDIMRINDDYVVGYDSRDQLLDLTPYMKKAGIKAEDYTPSTFNFPKQKDGTYPAWPIGSTPGIIYYNVDAFKAANVPLPPKNWTSDGWTWDDFLKAAHALTDEAAHKWGVIAFPDTSNETIYPVSNGGPGIYSMDGQTFALAEPEGYEAMQWLADLSLKEKVHPPFSETLAGNTTPNWNLSQLANGKVAMVTGTTGGIAYLRDNATVNWDIAPTPAKVAQTTISTLMALAIPKGSKNPDLAWDMINYATQETGGKILAETVGMLPVKKSVAATIKMDSKGPANFQLVQQALEHSVNENFSVNISRARTIYRPVLDYVYSGQKTAKEALQGVQKQVNDVLQGKAS